MSLLFADAATGEILAEVYDDLPESSSPLAFDTYAVVAAAVGTVTGLNTVTGDVLWKTEFPVSFYASPVLAGGFVYLLDRAGTMRILKASDTYEVIASPSVGEPADATPAFVGRRIYIRGIDHLFCIGASE
jgi:outer membrane protein assembly factor BamB